MNHALSFRALALAIAVLPSLAAAGPLVPPLASPTASPAPAPPPAGRVVLPAPAQPPRQVKPLRLAGSLGFDIGFTDLLEVEMEDGSSQSISANQGFFASVGAAFLPLLDGRLETQATLGVKYAGIEASNGSASIVTFPIEVVEALHVDPLRFAAGIAYLYRPSMSGDGVLSAFDVEFESSVGLLLEADWTWRSRPGAPVLAIGPRFLFQRMQVRGGGPVVDANAIGFVMSFTGG